MNPQRQNAEDRDEAGEGAGGKAASARGAQAALGGDGGFRHDVRIDSGPEVVLNPPWALPGTYLRRYTTARTPLGSARRPNDGTGAIR